MDAYKELRGIVANRSKAFASMGMVANAMAGITGRTTDLHALRATVNTFHRSDWHNACDCNM